jgi:hypothetical protein
MRATRKNLRVGMVLERRNPTQSELSKISKSKIWEKLNKK